MERALLVTADFQDRPPASALPDRVEELKELALAAALKPLKDVFFTQRSPNPTLLLGSGKAQEIAQLAKDQRADVVVFGSPLSSTQQRNLEELLGRKTIDRTQLILDIFAQRAKSTEGKLQVELAQLKYLLPRLSGQGIYLSRLGGGVGTRGPGEQKLETDRRRIRERITALTRELDALKMRRLRGIASKREKNLPLVALVGYTGAGKSTLFNALTGAASGVKHRLFSTLDTTTRLLKLGGNTEALLVDTVGFVRDLPHHLVESFKATLEEVHHAELLLHVMDASRPDRAYLRGQVEKVLDQLDALGKRTLPVFNKTDLLAPAQRATLEREAAAGPYAAVSASRGQGIPALAAAIANILNENRRVREIFLPSAQLALAPWVYRKGQVLSRTDSGRGAKFKVNLSEEEERILRSRLEKGS